MTPGNEFKRRIVSNLRFQKDALSLVIDWVIAAYLIIPGLLIGGYFYVQLWNNPPMWLSLIPIPLMMAVTGTVAIAGSIRYFILSGDQLFLVYNQVWLRQFTKYGLIYSFAVKLFASLLTAALLLPAMRFVTGFSLIGWICLVWTAAVWGFSVRIAMEQWASRLYGWLRTVLNWIAGFAAAGIFTAITSAGHLHIGAAGTLALAGTLAAAAAAGWRLKRTTAHLYDVEGEYRMRTRLVALFMRDIQGFKAPSRRKRPVLFGRSQRLFRAFRSDTGAAEALIKSFYRSRAQAGFYLQLTFTATAGMLLAPALSKWILWVLVVAMLALWMRSYCRQAMEGDFMSMFVMDKSVKTRASAKAAFWNAQPANLLLGVILGASLYGLPGALAMLIVAPSISWVVTGIVCSF